MAGVLLVATRFIQARKAAVVYADGDGTAGAVGDADDGDVVEEGGVQGGEAVVVHGREAA